MGAGHYFLVLEGPLSGDTHSLDPAPDKSGGPPPDFFLAPFFTIFHIFYLPLFFLLTPPVFFSTKNIHILINIPIFTYQNPHHRRHVAEFRLLPASQASPP